MVLGGKAGIGTVVAGFTIGYCIQTTFKVLHFDPTSIKHTTLNDTIKYVLDKK